MDKIKLAVFCRALSDMLPSESEKNSTKIGTQAALVAQEECNGLDDVPEELLRYDRKFDRRSCSPFGSISFESFLDPGFDEHVSGSRDNARVRECVCEIRHKAGQVMAGTKIACGNYN